MVRCSRVGKKIKNDTTVYSCIDKVYREKEKEKIEIKIMDNTTVYSCCKYRGKGKQIEIKITGTNKMCRVVPVLKQRVTYLAM